jgi:photosystem II stability/assembly factor-like uncharacterized protein
MGIAATPASARIARRRSWPVGASTFFGHDRKDGVLAVDYMHYTESEGIDISYTVVYTTHDGGNTWQASTPAKESGGIISFIDARRGWMWDVSGDDIPTEKSAVIGTLRKTEDGGHSWADDPA